MQQAFGIYFINFVWNAQKCKNLFIIYYKCENNIKPIKAKSANVFAVIYELTVCWPWVR